MIHNLDAIDNSSPPAAKIALFRSLFRGRDDVYPRRFESRKTGRAGYAPACAHEWVSGICEKPRIKCADCPKRRFLPVTDEVMRWHLSGHDDEGQPFVAGVYPLLLDETCFFIAIDFDKTGWQEDSLAFMGACRRLDLPAALERSRSGRGAHVWLFFEEAKAGSHKPQPRRAGGCPRRSISARVNRGYRERVPQRSFSRFQRRMAVRDRAAARGDYCRPLFPLRRRLPRPEQIADGTDNHSGLVELDPVAAVRGNHMTPLA